MQKRKIFIVDDSRVQLILLEKTLLAAGFSVRSFSRGSDLMEVLKDKTPDLIISDIDMPELDGFELVSAIREIFDKTAIPFLLISSEGGRTTRDRAHQAGADLFLEKPFEYDNLVEVIGEMLPQPAM